MGFAALSANLRETRKLDLHQKREQALTGFSFGFSFGFGFGFGFDFDFDFDFGFGFGFRSRNESAAAGYRGGAVSEHQRASFSAGR